jgi:DNA repair protein RadC
LPQSESDFPGDVNFVRIYANLLEVLEKEIEQPKLGDLLAQLRASGVSESLPVMQDNDILRMLSRLGFIKKNYSAEAKGKIAETVVREISEAVSRTPAQVSMILRLYASGLYGIMPRAVCGTVPRCGNCGLTKECDYYNAPKTPQNERIPLAKRFAREGADALGDEEIVTLILGGQKAGESHKEMARVLLKRYGSLRNLSGIAYGELASLRGVNESYAVRLAAASAYQKRILSERKALGPAVRSGKDFYDLYAATLRDLKKEVFLVVLLDQKNRVLREEKVSEGTLTASLVHPREVFGPAIRESAAAIAFVHNHPSGDSSPSPEDIALTERLNKSASLIGVRILDHVIIGEGSYTSFVDEGLLK